MLRVTIVGPVHTDEKQESSHGLHRSLGFYETVWPYSYDKIRDIL